MQCVCSSHRDCTLEGHRNKNLRGVARVAMMTKGVCTEMKKCNDGLFDGKYGDKPLLQHFDILATYGKATKSLPM
jgi:hypothetical protein